MGDGIFPTTSWTLVAEAQADEAALNTLLTAYWRPVYAYLRRKGHRPEDAADLTQSFLSEVVIGRNLIGRADAARGRFRTFLLTALNRFQIDAHRRARARGAGRTVNVPTDPAVLDASEPQAELDAAAAFDHLWASTVINLALEKIEVELEREGLAKYWTAFRERVLLPATTGSAPTPIGELAARFGLGDHQQVSHMVYTVKRRFRQTVRRVVADTVVHASDVDVELDYLLGLVAILPA